MKHITDPSNIEDFLLAIDREYSKRLVTYPKIVAKKQKEWADQGLNVHDLTIELTITQRIQFDLLQDVRSFVLNRAPENPHGINDACFRELQRELRLRKQMYPRWITFGIMDQDTAGREIAVWNSLTIWFHQEFCPDSSWRKPPVRKVKKVNIEKLT